MDTLELINKLNSLSPYGVNITNSSFEESDSSFEIVNISDIQNIKTKEWKVTSIFNPLLGDISYSVSDKDLG